MLFDSHCHLFDDRFRDDLDAVLKRARQAGVTGFVVPGVDLATGEQALALARQHGDIYAAVGLHPESLAEASLADVPAIAALTQDERVVAVGEIGLDYYWDTAPRDVQQEVLRAQLRLAKERRLPVIIHNRDATLDTVRLLEEEAAPELTGVMHCFSADWPAAERCLAIGFYISFGGPVTFKSNKVLQEVAARVPDDRLLVETDSPYLSPHPLRGKRNEPERVRLVAEKLAELRGQTVDEVARLTTGNARRLFGIEDGAKAREDGPHVRL
ncbi:TatD family hydrolase [Alicyclobacillus shizuokensis]|uniref:TatD family hydrolase n=1 Tax=Alicyclobacillus shizuokensis TaxID=392014 RepID=UPI00083573FB|nr:TatD family hydrolase [Alicyclobacillus shizuokensis]MCL6626435.1 TatD family hydrolase [Alicyclobacillus shizuokensis]